MNQVFLVIRRDRADAAGLRAETRPDHLRWLAGSPLTVRLAGPLLDPNGGHAQGSIFFVEASAIAVVRVWAGEDPYAKAGVFEHTEIRPFTAVIGGFAETAQKAAGEAPGDVVD